MVDINKYIYAASFFAYLYIKIFFIFIFGEMSFLNVGGGSDADYYAAVVQSNEYSDVNIWPLLLSALNETGIYSRKIVVYILFLLSSVFIPYLVFEICKDKKSNLSWLAMMVVGFYPPLFYFSLDIYRDVFMFFLFIFGVFSIKKMIEGDSKTGFFLSVIIFFPLYGLRSYLGFSFLMMILLSFLKINTLSRGCLNTASFKFIFLYVLILYAMFFLGFLNPLFEYRELFNGLDGGSTFGLNLNSKTMFLPDFALSWIFQVLGLWPVDIFYVVLFFIEGVPFLIFLLYILRYKKYADKFVLINMGFFYIYTAIWVIANDNLGTAWRLRMFSYAAVLFAYIRVRQNKRKMKIIK